MASPTVLTVPSPVESGSQESSTAGRKRRNSANDAGTGRAVKHRSPQACRSCRMRKVRCDILVNGSRCTNCRLDQLECVVVASRRGKNNRTHRNVTTQNAQSPPVGSANATSDSGPNMGQNAVWTDHDAAVRTPTVPSAGAGNVPVCVTFDEDLENGENDLQSTMTDDGIRNDTELSPSEACIGLQTPETGAARVQHHQTPIGKAALPAFICPLPSRIRSEDLDFLAMKGALTVPEPDLQVEILRGYLFSVHPFMPMLNFREFIQVVLGNREDGRISLLLFQAVMFAGLNSLQLPVIYRLGFESTKQAREVFFNRVRLLYEFDVEADSATVLQSLVLMSSWYSKWDERRDTWYWTGLAYDNARRMGLHREPTTRYATEKVRRFRRRLWWSLYIRDRMIALGTRRPMRIRDEDFDVTMLTLEDFDLEPLDKLGLGQPLIPDAKENTSTALMCIQLARLCRCIGHVVSSQYTTLSTQPNVAHAVMVVSRRDEGYPDELEACERELKEWFQALETNVQRTGMPTTQQGPHSCSEVHWAVLNMTYHTVVNVLHRSKALQPLPNAAEAQVVQRASRAKVKEAARSLTKLSQSMLRHDQVRFLGLIGVTALVAACLSHMLDISSADEDVRDASTFRLYQSLEVLQSLRRIYASADASAYFLASVSRKAGISFPAQVVAPITDFAATTAGGSMNHSAKTGQLANENDSTGFHDLSDVRTNKPGVDWQVSSLQNLTQLANGRPQEQPPLDGSGQTLFSNGMMQPPPKAGTVSSSTTARTPLNSAREFSHRPTDVPHRNPITGHPLPQFVDTNFGGAAADGAFFDWNNGIDTAGTDFEPMSFNYDFYSDAFGFLNGHLQAG